MIQLLLQNNETLTTRKENLNNDYFKDKLDNDVLRLNVNKAYMNEYLDNVLTNNNVYFQENSYDISVRGKIFSLELKQIERFEYLKSLFFTFKQDETPFLDINDDKFNDILNDMDNNFMNVKNNCMNELLYLGYNTTYAINENNNESIYDENTIIQSLELQKMNCYFVIDPEITFHKKQYRRFTGTKNYVNEIKPTIKNNIYIFTFQSMFLSHIILKVKIFIPEEFKHYNILWLEHSKIVENIDVFYGDDFLTSVPGVIILINNIFNDYDTLSDCYEYVVCLDNVLNTKTTKINIYDKKLTLKIKINDPYAFLNIDLKQDYFEPTISYNGLILTNYEKNRFLELKHEYLVEDNILYSKTVENINYVDFDLEKNNIVSGFIVCVDNFLNPLEHILRIELITDDKMYFSLTPKMINIFNTINKIPNNEKINKKIIFYNFNFEYSNNQPCGILNLRNYEHSKIRIHLKHTFLTTIHVAMTVKNIYNYSNNNVKIEKDKISNSTYNISNYNN